MQVLVVGGAGYIGSHMCKMLAESGHQVSVCDNLSTGHREAVKWGKLVPCRLSDEEFLDPFFAQQRFDAVMHFAASSIVSESLAKPLRYYRNNICETVALLDLMQRHGVDKFVFSSSAAVYGQPRQSLIDELHPSEPINPYGRTKLIVEQMLSDLAQANQLGSVSLRYFNAAGADESGLIGESHNPETHLIPRILRKAAGETIQVGIFGVDYPTADGSCIRDYIHVNDLCSAHLRALEYLSRNGGFSTFNLGNGQGYSVRQVVAAAEEVTGRRLNIAEHERRPGDPAALVASSEKARRELGWVPVYPDINKIIESAWRWHSNPRY